MKIILSTEAKQDLNRIFEYISIDSIKYAIETTKNIRISIHNLENSPYIGRYVPELLSKQYRELLYKSYRIIYSVSGKSNTIYIHFIIHSRRNLKSFFNLYLQNNNF